MTDRLITNANNHNTIQMLTTVIVVVACLLLAGPINAQDQAQQLAPRLTSDSDIASAGFFRLLWETDAAHVELQESKHASFKNAHTYYKGPDRAIVISGKPDGTWYYRIRAIEKRQAGPWSDSVVVMLAEQSIEDPALTAKIGFTPSCLQPWLASSMRVPALLNPDHRAALSDYSPGAAIADALDTDALKNRHPLDRAQYVWIKTMLEGQILTWGGDRVDMANAMEARPPFLDHHLAEYAAMLPPSLRIHGRTEKYVLREAMKGLLPETLYKREKFAFMAPPAHTDPSKWAALQALARRHLNPADIEDAGLLDAKGVAALFKLHEASDTSAATQTQLDAVFNHLIGVQVLHKHFIASDIPAQARRKAEELSWRAANIH